MKTFGLIGKHIQHSFSPSYFEQKFQKEKIDNCVYKLFPLAKITELHPLLQTEKTLVGLNVTIPYKQAIISLLDELSPQANAIGAVNTIKIQQGRLIGHNTDVYGFKTSLEQALTNEQRATKALVLGTGGASKAVVHALSELEIPYQYVSRSNGKNLLTYEDITSDLLANHLLVINTTPLGMSPNIEGYPSLPYHAIGKQHLLFDLIYNPLQTVFIKKGQQYGATTINGLEMLHLQAEKAWNIWME